MNQTEQEIADQVMRGIAMLIRIELVVCVLMLVLCTCLQKWGWSIVFGIYVAMLAAGAIIWDIGMKRHRAQTLCPYHEKPCELWDEECLAVHPSQCPYNTEEDNEAIIDWQERQVR